MTIYNNLIPGQYQIDNYVIGKGTNVIVEQFDAKPYDVNAQDYQLPRSDEIRFGFDQLKPTTVEIQMQVIYNRLLEPFTDTTLVALHKPQVLPTHHAVVLAQDVFDLLLGVGTAEHLGVEVIGQHDLEAARAWHFPLGVLIFGLAVMIVMMAWQEKAARQ